MDSFISLLFLLAFCSATTTALAQRNISLGSSLTPTGGNSSWSSPSGLFAYGFYRVGDRYGVGIFVAGIPQKTVVWTANRDTNPTFPSNASLILSRDGRLLVQQLSEDETVIYAGTASNQTNIASASMLDSGNFVLYNAQGRIIWQSFDNPTDTMLPGQSLKPSQRLVSSVSETDFSEGKFFIIMQADGNLVMYPTITVAISTAYYATMTFGNHTLNLKDDGYLYLMNSSSVIIRNISNGGYPRKGRLCFLKMDIDGIAKLYSFALDHGNQSIIWQSTNDQCAPLGRCGFNSYCTTMDDQMECKCLPGFEFVIPGNWSLGCERNFAVENCKSETSHIVPLAGVVWENNPFSEVPNEASEDCERACLDDCNCEVAFWKDGNCGMQRLPMRFGRRASDSNVGLIKVGNGLLVSPAAAPSVVLVKKKVRLDVLIVGICLGVIGILFFVASRVKYGKMCKKIGTFDRENCEFLEGVAPRAFSFEELKQATDDFSQQVGRGAFGTVYKGILQDFEKPVAVKKLENVRTEGEKEFKNEIRAIGKTHHRNLVKFLGYCLDGTKKLLVYDYMSNGSLADFLFNRGADHQIPSWDERIRIAKDVARGILYLHQECDTQIIHCDIKPENILLDESRCAKISDFGLAKLLDPEQTRTFTGVRGTKGYVAPEWHRKSAVTVKADVFSFGIVLLEIICCRKSVDFSLPDEEAVLEEFCYDCFQNGSLHELVPAGDQEQVGMSKFERMIKIALWCIQYDPSFRPSMNKIVLMLEGTVDIPLPPCPAETFLSAS